MLIELYRPTKEECLAGNWTYFSNGYVQVIDSKYYYWQYFGTPTEAIQKLIPRETWHDLCYNQSFDDYRNHTFSNPIFSITVDSFDDLQKVYPEYFI